MGTMASTSQPSNCAKKILLTVCSQYSRRLGDPRLLEVELTESVLMKHAEYTASVLKALRAGGVQVAVDDFGTGYSRLSYLRQFPIDALKIDQSFVSQITTVPDETIIVKAVISMGRSLTGWLPRAWKRKNNLAFLQAHQCEREARILIQPAGAYSPVRQLLETGLWEVVR